MQLEKYGFTKRGRLNIDTEYKEPEIRILHPPKKLWKWHRFKQTYLVTGYFGFYLEDNDTTLVKLTDFPLPPAAGPREIARRINTQINEHEPFDFPWCNHKNSCLEIFRGEEIDTELSSALL